MCGKCCYGLRLPLTVAEALAWMGRGNEVQILCEALPWPEEPAADNLQAAHKRRRSFAAMSGSLPTRIVVILTGAFAGPCPNLQADMRCGIYEERPLVCRIYPAEINPFIQLEPAAKGCPPEAWTPGLAPLMRAGQLVDATTADLIERSSRGCVRCSGLMRLRWRMRGSLCIRRRARCCWLRFGGLAMRVLVLEA